MGASVESFGQRLLDIDGMEFLFNMPYDSNAGKFAKYYNATDRNFLSMIEKLKGYRYLFATITNGTINPTATSEQSATTFYSLYRIDKEEMQHAYDFVSRRYSTSTNYQLNYAMRPMSGDTAMELHINFKTMAGSGKNSFTTSLGYNEGAVKLYGIK